MLGLFVCASLVFNHESSYSTSTLIQRNQEELVQSPSPGIRLHSLVALSVTHIHPPLGVLSIGIRAYAPDIWFNHPGV